MSDHALLKDLAQSHKHGQKNSKENDYFSMENNFGLAFELSTHVLSRWTRTDLKRLGL